IRCLGCATASYRPTSGERPSLAVEEIALRACQKQHCLSAFSPGRDAAGGTCREPLAESVSFLVRFRKIGGILDVGLRRRIDVDVGSHLHRDMSHVAMLGGARATVEGHAAASTAQTVSATYDDDFAALPF